MSGHARHWDNSEERYERRNWTMIPEKRLLRFVGIMENKLRKFGYGPIECILPTKQILR